MRKSLTNDCPIIASNPFINAMNAISNINWDYTSINGERSVISNRY